MRRGAVLRVRLRGVMRLPRLVALVTPLFAIAGCFPGAQLRNVGAPRASIESLWDFAPRDASDGVIFHKGSFSRALALATYLEAHETPHHDVSPDAPAEDDPPALETPEDWDRAGFDPSLDAAAFSWADRARGVLFVLPLGDRERFRAAFKAKTRWVGSREVDDVIGGYSCAMA